MLKFMKLPLFFLAFLLCAQGLMAIEMSADFTQTDSDGTVTTGRIYYKGNLVRTETEADGQTVVSILRGDKQVVWTLMPDNTYIEVGIPEDWTDPESEPVGEWTEKDLGTEVVSGYECQVKQYTYKKKSLGIMVHWFSPKLGFTIKIENRKANGKVVSTTVYTNIKVGKQPKSLFELPAGAQPSELGNLMNLF